MSGASGLLERLEATVPQPGPGSLVRICWALGGGSGHGAPMAYVWARSWVASFNARYGAGTHWIEPVLADDREEP